MTTREKDAASSAQTMRPVTSPARAALAALAKPAAGIDGAVANAAYRAVDAAAGRSSTVAAHMVVEAVEPIVVDETVDRLLRGARESAVQWASRFHYTDGRPATVGDPTSRHAAYLGVKGLNHRHNAGYRRANCIDRSELVTRQVVTLRDGSVFSSPWTPVTT